MGDGERSEPKRAPKKVKAFFVSGGEQSEPNRAPKKRLAFFGKRRKRATGRSFSERKSEAKSDVSDERMFEK